MSKQRKILGLRDETDPDQRLSIALSACFETIEVKIVQNAFKHYGLPAILTVSELSEMLHSKMYQRKQLPKIVGRAVQVSLLLDSIRKHVAEDNTKAAVFETIQMMGQFGRYQHLTTERHVIKGKKSAADAKKGGRRSGAVRKVKAEFNANEILVKANELRDSGTSERSIPKILAMKFERDDSFAHLRRSARTISNILRKEKLKANSTSNH